MDINWDHHCLYRKNSPFYALGETVALYFLLALASVIVSLTGLLPAMKYLSREYFVAYICISVLLVLAFLAMAYWTFNLKQHVSGVACKLWMGADHQRRRRPFSDLELMNWIKMNAPTISSECTRLMLP